MRTRTPKGTLIAVDGVDERSLLCAAGDALAACERANRGGISRWDASGIFEELAVADERAGRPSARTLLLLYAADLAFRLRWEIRPALSQGLTVVAAPYVSTAVAFGRSAGLPAAWLSNLFRFAPRPAARIIVQTAAARRASDRKGFVEFGRERWVDAVGPKRQQMVDRTLEHLCSAASRLPSRPRTRV
jgi:thymidylate kinase